MMGLNFKVNDYCVYNTHGIAKIIEIKEITVNNVKNKCLVLFFEKEKLTLMVPYKFKENGDIRRLSTIEELDKVFDILKCGVKKLKGMWSRRAKEYKDKINSGDIYQIAEVLKDLIRDVDEADRSYSEKSIYDIAIYRLASELSLVKKISYKEAEKQIITVAKERVASKDLKEA